MARPSHLWREPDEKKCVQNTKANQDYPPMSSEMHHGSNVEGSIVVRGRNAIYKPTTTFYSRASPVNSSFWLGR